MTERQARDLLLIEGDGPLAKIAYDERRRGWVICCGLRGAIPPAATERLITRGWIVTTGEDQARVTISLAGVIALAWRGCKELGLPAGQFADQIAESVVDVYGPEF